MKNKNDLFTLNSIAYENMNMEFTSFFDVFRMYVIENKKISKKTIIIFLTNVLKLVNLILYWFEIIEKSKTFSYFVVKYPEC